ncbi:MAG: hypothetical protein NC131_12755 [Roseburia sp.]|nr:hypothetical protein [Roseburia sp.]
MSEGEEFGNLTLGQAAEFVEVVLHFIITDNESVGKGVFEGAEATDDEVGRVVVFGNDAEGFVTAVDVGKHYVHLKYSL